jgi:adenylyltransferase/sulfurtransferase
LTASNSEIQMEPVVIDVNGSNIGPVIQDVDLVLGGTDNAETRYLINEACDKWGKPWIYSGALAGSGMTMDVIPRETACLRCVFPCADPAANTCATAGVLNSVTGIVAGIASTEAIKLLTGPGTLRKTLLCIGVWDFSVHMFDVEQNPNCPVCANHRYEMLSQPPGAYTTTLCGRSEVIVSPARESTVDFQTFAIRLSKIGAVVYDESILHFSDGAAEFLLFRDGRAIIKNVKDALYHKIQRKKSLLRRSELHFFSMVATQTHGAGQQSPGRIPHSVIASPAAVATLRRASVRAAPASALRAGRRC